MTPRARMLIAATAFLAALSGCQGLACPFCRPGSYCPIHHTYTLTEQEQQELLASKAAEEKRLREAEERRKVHKPAVSADGGPILPGVARTTTVGKRFGDGASQNTPAATTDERSSGVSVLPAGPFYPLGTEQPSEPSERGPILQAVTDKRDEPAKEPLLEAMRCVLENRPSDALAYLQTYDHPTQEFFLRMLPPMALLAHKKLDKLSPGEVAVLNEQLESLLTTLRPQTELVIGTMCFCEAVKSYGVYDRVPDDHVFQAGSGGQPGERVLLYVELHNFCSERRASYHETRLASAVEITDGQGRQIWYYRFDDRKQPLRSLSQLHDYFSTYSFHVPHLPPGAYTLTLQVTDETLPEVPRVARKTLPFRVVPPAGAP